MLLLSTVITFLVCDSVYAVNRPPHIYEQPVSKTIFYKFGDPVQITCIANGTPKPKYRWQKNGISYNVSSQHGRVVQLPDEGTIVFKFTLGEDDGIFQCFADNGYGISVSIKIHMREAILDPFTGRGQDFFVNRGESLVLPCTPPESYPPAVVDWVVMASGSDGSWTDIKFDKRVSMDTEGNLWFTNVWPSDERAGKEYVCRAINQFSGSQKFAPGYVVNVEPDPIHGKRKRPVYELWTSPSDQIFLKGKLLRFQCIFAGNPTADVSWKKLDGQLPDRAKLRSGGQELQISDLDQSDAGRYECSGTNSETTQPKTKIFTVYIESGPYWTKKPENIEVGLNETATFTCEADGMPEPEYIWYINGVIYDDVNDTRIHDNPRVLKTNNQLTITNLTLDDHFNIQCNATNKHDYVFADVYLNILTEKPVTSILLLPPLKKTIHWDGRSKSRWPNK